jgi:hypothetical protein
VNKTKKSFIRENTIQEDQSYLEYHTEDDMKRDFHSRELNNKIFAKYDKMMTYMKLKKYFKSINKKSVQNRR